MCVKELPDEVSSPMHQRIIVSHERHMQYNHSIAIFSVEEQSIYQSKNINNSGPIVYTRFLNTFYFLPISLKHDSATLLISMLNINYRNNSTHAHKDMSVQKSCPFLALNVVSLKIRSCARS